MHCGLCGGTDVEVRPCYIEPGAYSGDSPYELLSGDVMLCQRCATGLAVHTVKSDSIRHARENCSFVTWRGLACATCGTPAGFAGPIPGLPEGVICDECNATDVWGGPAGTWVCNPCFDQHHAGHRQRTAVPLLDLLAMESVRR